MPQHGFVSRGLSVLLLGAVVAGGCESAAGGASAPAATGSATGGGGGTSAGGGASGSGGKQGNGGASGIDAGPDAAAETGGPTDAVRADTAAALDVQAGTDPPPPPPPGYPAGAAPRTEQKSLLGTTTKQTIAFNVYLPPGYDGGSQRYPVIYDLHGLTGNQGENGQWVIPSLEAAMRANAIGPVIVVFPDGLPESYYADSFDGKRPSESRIIRDLIPHIDATYRTIAHRRFRAVTGFSMGGYGSLALATKFPDVFRAGIAYDAALDTWQTLVGRRAYIAEAQFGNSEAHFDKHSPWANATANAAVLRTSVALRLVPGTQYQMFDAAFRDHLAGLAIPLHYSEAACPHDYGCVLRAEGAKSWAFLQAAFARP